MSTIVNLAMEQGSNFLATIQMVAESGNIKNLANCTARSLMKKTYATHANTEFTVTIDNPDEGEVVLSLSANVTANIKAGRYVYDLQLTNEDLTIDRIIEGIVTVYPGVTKIWEQ